jgi:hypothetical protein
MKMVKKKAVFLFMFVCLLITQFGIVPFSGIPCSLVSAPLYSVQAMNAIPVQASDIRFGYNYLVTDGSSPYPEQVEPTLTVLNSGRLLIGWKEADTATGPGRRVGFCYSNDEGQTFSPNILMEPVGSGDYQSDPWLVSDNNDNAYFVFLEYGGLDEGMGVVKTLDGGSSWLSPVQASDTNGFDDKETACVDANGNIYMMWDHFPPETDTELVFTKSTNGGASFQPTQILGLWATHGGIPYLTCTPNGTLFVSTIWDSNPVGPIDTIFFMKSQDFGASWTGPHQVNPPGFGEIAIITVCATDSNHHIYICFAAGSQSDKEVYVTKSVDGGSSWSTPVQVNDVTANMQRMVEMHIDANDNIHVAWLDARNNVWDIYYSYSADGGVTFSEDVRITTQGFPLSFTRPGDYFTLRSGPTGKLYIVWTDGRAGTDQDIYFAKQDMAAPTISLTPLAPVTTHQPVTITVEATDDDHLSYVELFWHIDQGYTHHVQMLEVSGNTYEYTIPGSAVNGTTLTFYIGANDTAGRYTRLPSDPEAFFNVAILVPLPTFLFTLVIGVIIIVVVFAIAVWYLRRN